METVPDFHVVTGGAGLAPPRVEREPPAKNEKQRKTIVRSARLGMVIYKALDEVSEKAEIVDAFYEALPEDVRRRRPCKDHSGTRRMVDTLGQYGIDQADCKLRVLYDNFHRVDLVAAIKGVVKNYVADQVIGFYQRYTPDQYS